MNINVYSIWDLGTETYSPPFTAENDHVAKRMFAHALGSNALMAGQPGDFHLMQLGVFDQRQGTFENHRAAVQSGPAALAAVQEQARLARESQGQLFNQETDQ